jgi:hypothetical protein
MCARTCAADEKEAAMSPKKRPVRNNLEGARVYLSGPMDFVASREEEQKYGWRTRVGAFLRARGCVVFDPWEKPAVRGLHDYGREGSDTTKVREAWTFDDTRAGAAARSKLTGHFWETLHIDLRMVDTSDFVVAYCPTNIYSVGTPHEIALARQQRKPVLLVSPPVECRALEALQAHLARAHDAHGAALLQTLETQVPIKPNPGGIPSLWYMPLVGGQGFFDGFGFDQFRGEFGWPEGGPLDEREKGKKPARPLLRFLNGVTRRLPQKWSASRRDYVQNDDWLLWDLHPDGQGAEVVGPHPARGDGSGRGRRGVRR